MIFFKKIKSDINQAFGIGLSSKRLLSKFKRKIRKEITENELNRKNFQSATKKDMNILQEDIESVVIYSAIQIKTIQDNMELLVNEINDLRKIKIKKEEKRIQSPHVVFDFTKKPSTLNDTKKSQTIKMTVIPKLATKKVKK